MERRTPSKFNSQIYGEACEWFIECRSGQLDRVMRQEFARWLSKSPEHMGAYLEIAAIWNEGPQLDRGQDLDAERLIAEASADRDNVVDLHRALPAAEPRVAASSRHLPWLAACIALVVVCAATALSIHLLRAPTYATAIGEQRSIMLADGSTVELNSRSKIRVRYSRTQRTLELLAGQALFRVARDHARPFVVASDGTRVRAVGTEFDVYRKRSDTIVTVVEGRVAVLRGALAEAPETIALDAVSLPQPAVPDTEHPAGQAPAVILLSAGEQVTVTREAVREIVHPNIATAIAWRQRQLVFESASLGEVAEEFNRYNERPLVVPGTGPEGFHISGVFSSTDPASLIRFLRDRPEVRVVETPSAIHVTGTSPEEVTDP